jgi:vacuolar-type H+-ATPase subunit H
VAEADKKAREALEDAEHKAQEERNHMIRDAKEEITEMVIDASSKMTASKAGPETDHALYEKFIEENKNRSAVKSR